MYEVIFSDRLANLFFSDFDQTNKSTPTRPVVLIKYIIILEVRLLSDKFHHVQWFFPPKLYECIILTYNLSLTFHLYIVLSFKVRFKVVLASGYGR